MDVNIISENKDGDSTRPIAPEAPSILDVPNQKLEGTKKKRRRGKSKRKIMKPFVKTPWQDGRKYDKSKRNYRFRKMVLANTHAPFNNNQFLMEIHKPEPESSFHDLQTPSARTRDSSFSVDSEDNYFFSLPEDEEEYLTKEFSSVYEDAQSERLSNMSKSELIQEYLLLEAKYDNLVKRSDRRPKGMDEDKDITVDLDNSLDKDGMMIEKDTSGTSIESNLTEESSSDLLQRLKEQEDQIRELQAANEKLRLDNEHLRQRTQSSSSEDSESDSSTSASDSSSSRSTSPIEELATEVEVNGYASTEEPVMVNGVNGTAEAAEPQPLVNGFHDSNDLELDDDP
ncbi:protein HEXIM1 [Cydia pomonella]|uniref:protein HEXIM1 n=1 Tax=Cydia pomonella TaxID=82600 RepID=UPI002ADE222D|nr:protein HEXIM1 [Cydia pomonella]